MPDRLSPLDVSFLYLEEPTTPMHAGEVAVFERRDGGFDHARLVALIAQRIAFVPRYRERVRWVPGRLANPVWVDDENFDLIYHVRRSALPRPGSAAQLGELVGRIMGRRLNRRKPLWEVYLVEGLHDGRFALVTKTHHALVDGVNALDIGQVILDPSAQPRVMPAAAWRPAPEPTWVELVAGALSDSVRRPTALLDRLSTGAADLTTTAGRVLGTAAGVLAVARTATRPAPDSPLNAVIGEARRFAAVDTDLDDYRRIRKAYGGTVNDVILTVVTGALRGWLQTRGAVTPPGAVVRALLPVSVGSGDIGDGAEGTGEDSTAALDNRVSPYLVDLPVGEPDPVMRLHQVSHAMRAHKDTGQAVAAEALMGIAGFAPPTLHALGARLTNTLSRKLFNTVVTNVPGPQVPLYADGARMLASYPVVPLAKGQAVSIGLTSYNGGVFYGLNADRDAMPDVDDLADAIGEALRELGDTVR